MRTHNHKPTVDMCFFIPKNMEDTRRCGKIDAME